jgi:hypothetical protein
MSPAPARKTELGRRPDIETELSDRYHVDWAYLHAVDVSEFDVDKSLQNQARFEALDEDTVEQYREAVLRGDPFPAVIAYRPRKNGKLLIIDGNHRLVAHERAERPIEVYEVAQGTRPQTVALMTFAFNTRHGRPTSEEERVSQALYLIDNGASIGAAASAVNVPERIVKRAVARANADKRADEVGADRREWDALAASTRSRLLNITTDEGFKDAVHLAFAARLGSEETFELVSLLNSSKSATKQRALVKAESQRYSDRIQDAAGGVLTTADRRAVGPKQRIGMALGQVMALPDDIRAIAKTYAAAEKSAVAAQLIDASERLRKIALALDSSAA